MFVVFSKSRIFSFLWFQCKLDVLLVHKLLYWLLFSTFHTRSLKIESFLIFTNNTAAILILFYSSEILQRVWPLERCLTRKGSQPRISEAQFIRHSVAVLCWPNFELEAKQPKYRSKLLPFPENRESNLLPSTNSPNQEQLNKM